jgi:hydroxymethylpyrimidine pyrophosphatase-like HAD family hydrolase
VIAITGRPVGWSLPFAADWPVDAIVAENGSVGIFLTKKYPTSRNSVATSSLSKIYQQSEKNRADNLQRMQWIAQKVLLAVPGATLAQDSAGRETDIAFDHSEFTTLPAATIAHIVRLLQDEGMTATVSSIHINAWFGDHTKLSGARWIVGELFGRDWDAERDQWAYVGDSTNDQLMFSNLQHSVGVANVQRFADQLTHAPRYVTPSARGAGFAEFAQAILAARAGR